MSDRINDPWNELMEPVLTRAAGVPEELSVAQIADLLMLSVGYVENLLDAGEIPSRRDRDGQRAAKEDVLAWHQRSLALRAEALAELAVEAQAMGFYDRS